MRYSNNYKMQWLKGEKRKTILALLLVFAFPLGLYVMWTESDYKSWIKWSITLAWLIVIVAFVSVFFLTSVEYETGNIVSSSTVYEGKMLGPQQPAEMLTSNGRSQVLPQHDSESTLISEPTPTPVPTYVYCNDNGVYYHLKSCRYVYDGKTPRVTLTQALNAGKTACQLCNPPKEETYGN